MQLTPSFALHGQTLVRRQLERYALNRLRHTGLLAICYSQPSLPGNAEMLSASPLSLKNWILVFTAPGDGRARNLLQGFAEQFVLSRMHPQATERYNADQPFFAINYR